MEYPKESNIEECRVFFANNCSGACCDCENMTYKCGIMSCAILEKEVITNEN